MIAYSKSTEDGEIILIAVNLDPRYRQSGWIDLDLEEFGLPAEKSFQVHDLLTDARFLWHGARNYIELDPQTLPAHVFRIRRKVRTEHDFDYYL
jgi:starch synthase (maltosyl-transferring)